MGTSLKLSFGCLCCGFLNLFFSLDEPYEISYIKCCTKCGYYLGNLIKLKDITSQYIYCADCKTHREFSSYGIEDTYNKQTVLYIKCIDCNYKIHHELISKYINYNQSHFYSPSITTGDTLYMKYPNDIIYVENTAYIDPNNFKKQSDNNFINLYPVKSKTKDDFDGDNKIKNIPHDYSNIKKKSKTSIKMYDVFDKLIDSISVPSSPKIEKTSKTKDKKSTDNFISCVPLSTKTKKTSKTKDKELTNNFIPYMVYEKVLGDRKYHVLNKDAVFVCGKKYKTKNLEKLSEKDSETILKHFKSFLCQICIEDK